MATTLLESYLVEMKQDRRFVDMLKKHMNLSGELSKQEERILVDWEAKRGTPLSLTAHARAIRFVKQRWPVVLQHFHGDEESALTTMINLLDHRFSRTKK